MNYYLLNAIVFLIDGALEALFWHLSLNKISAKTARLLHIPLVILRACFFAWAFYHSEYDGATISSLILCYPFWHLGAYYQLRHWITPSIYQLGFMSNSSSSSTAITERLLPLTFQFRTIFFVVGTGFYLLWNLF